ncbi:Endo-1,4-beta-xylanase 5 [Serendipita sp. 398]|nr:Endo-1,4-beta-xylanase 5 [Serendipita sp. 398]
MSKPAILKVKGDKIVDGEGNSVLLRGAGLGGWMNQENFITGYPGHEFQIREALDEVIGSQKAAFYWDKFLEYFFTEADATFYKSLGLNAIRIAFNYRHFEDDMNPRVLKPEGFKHLDRVVDICAKVGIYTILDFHAAAGGQNIDWHADNPTHVASFWVHKDFQDRAIWLWEELARHYKGNPWVAGYNILNEPTDPTHTRLQVWYDRCIKAIHAIDDEHIIFLDGNTFASDFSHFEGHLAERWPNCVYSVHDYSPFGFPASQEKYVGSDEQKAKVRRDYMDKSAWIRERGLPIWNGEFGPVYARKQYDGEPTEGINESRYLLLKDQLEVYDQEKISWSIWLYKDIGFQGMVYVGLDTPYMKRFEAFLLKKYTLAVDSWGADIKSIKHVHETIEKFITDAVPDPSHLELYPFPLWGVRKRVGRLVRNILLSEYLVREWAEHFRGLDEKALDELASSFKFENCVRRDGLNSVLREHHNISTNQ